MPRTSSKGSAGRRVERYLRSVDRGYITNNGHFQEHGTFTVLGSNTDLCGNKSIEGRTETVKKKEGQAKTNINYEVKLYFTVFLNYLCSLSFSVCLEETAIKERERERRNTCKDLIQSKSLATEVIWPKRGMPQSLQV